MTIAGPIRGRRGGLGAILGLLVLLGVAARESAAACGPHGAAAAAPHEGSPRAANPPHPLTIHAPFSPFFWGVSRANPPPPFGVHADRAARRHRHYRRLDPPPAARRPGRPRGRPPRPVRQQPQAD